MNYIKKEHQSFNIHMINTDKFKTTTIEIKIGRKFKREEITKANVLLAILKSSTKKYNSKIKYTLKMEDMYAATGRSIYSRMGNVLCLSLSLTILNDKYSEKGLFDQAMDFLYEVLFNPNAKDNSFDKIYFDNVMNDKKALIDSFKEYQRDYSIYKAFNLYDKDAPSSALSIGNIEDLNKITPQNLYEYYKEVIKSGDIDFVVIGDIDFEYVDNAITSRFKFNNKKQKENDYFIKYRKHREQIQEKIENNNTKQSALAVICSLEDLTDFEKFYVTRLYDIILGDGPNSKFFKNIREKKSLCYYASARSYIDDSIMLITSEINKENYNQVISLIQKEMQDMRDGKFTDSDVEDAKTLVISLLEELEDSPGRLIKTMYYCDRFKLNSIEQMRKSYEKITKKDIQSLANKVFIDTAFLLGGDKK